MCVRVIQFLRKDEIVLMHFLLKQEVGEGSRKNSLNTQVLDKTKADQLFYYYLYTILVFIIFFN